MPKKSKTIVNQYSFDKTLPTDKVSQLLESQQITEQILSINAAKNPGTDWEDNLNEFVEENYIMPVPHLLPDYGQNPGLRTAYATLLPAGGRVAAYVGPQSDATDQYASSGLLVSTLNAGLARVNSGVGDTIILLPGYAENCSTADFFTSLVAGTRIIGSWPGYGALMPTITFTAATATFLLDVANVYVEGVQFKLTGADAIAAAITASAAGCSVVNCKFNLGTDSTHDALVAVTVATGADDFLFYNNTCVSVSTATNTNVVLVSGAVASPKIISNYISTTSASTTVGPIHFSGAATNVDVSRNVIINGLTDGVGCSVAASTAVSGMFSYNNVGLTGTTATAATKAVLFSASVTATATAIQNFCSDEAAKFGVVSASGGAAN